jgi:hypothetical protein
MTSAPKAVSSVGNKYAHACRTGSNPPKNESARTQLESADARLNSPPPKSAHHELYVLIKAKGMARTGDPDSTIW